jgi:hypothetical protein
MHRWIFLDILRIRLRLAWLEWLVGKAVINPFVTRNGVGREHVFLGA